jgi:hypothetical protein
MHYAAQDAKSMTSYALGQSPLLAQNATFRPIPPELHHATNNAGSVQHSPVASMRGPGDVSAIQTNYYKESRYGILGYDVTYQIVTMLHRKTYGLFPAKPTNVGSIARPQVQAMDSRGRSEFIPNSSNAQYKRNASSSFFDTN